MDFSSCIGIIISLHWDPILEPFADYQVLVDLFRYLLENCKILQQSQRWAQPTRQTRAVYGQGKPLWRATTSFGIYLWTARWGKDIRFEWLLRQKQREIFAKISVGVQLSQREEAKILRLLPYKICLLLFCPLVDQSLHCILFGVPRGMIIYRATMLYEIIYLHLLRVEFGTFLQQGISSGLSIPIEEWYRSKNQKFQCCKCRHRHRFSTWIIWYLKCSSLWLKSKSPGSVGQLNDKHLTSFGE